MVDEKKKDTKKNAAEEISPTTSIFLEICFGFYTYV